MKVLHLIRSEPDETTLKIIEVQRKLHEVKVVDLTRKDIPYDDLIDDIFGYEKVISW